MVYKGYKGIYPSEDTIKKWQFTRKRTENDFLKIDKFQFPGIFTTQDIRGDAWFFWLAVFCEIGFLVVVSIMVGGFDWLLSFSAILCVVLDFIGAYFHHKNQNEICKARLRLNIERYKLEIGRSVEDDVRIKRERLGQVETDMVRRFGAGLIIFSAILKIAGSLILFEIPVFTIALCVIYCFVAWIHINKTGYCVAYYRFNSSLKKDLKNYIKNGSNDSVKAHKEEKDFDPKEIENIPDGIKLMAIRHYIFENSDIYDSLNPVGNKWFYRRWRYSFWDDNTALELINSKDDEKLVLSDSAKAFLLADISERIFLNV